MKIAKISFVKCKIIDDQLMNKGGSFEQSFGRNLFPTWFSCNEFPFIDDLGICKGERRSFNRIGVVGHAYQEIFIVRFLSKTHRFVFWIERSPCSSKRVYTTKRFAIDLVFSW